MVKSEFIQYLVAKTVNKAYLYEGKEFYSEAQSHVFDDEEILKILKNKVEIFPLYSVINN